MDGDFSLEAGSAGMDNIKTQITSHYLHIERMMSETTRIIRLCSKPIAITARVMRVAVGDYLSHLQLPIVPPHDIQHILGYYHKGDASHEEPAAPPRLSSRPLRSREPPASGAVGTREV